MVSLSNELNALNPVRDDERTFDWQAARQEVRVSKIIFPAAMH